MLVGGSRNPNQEAATQSAASARSWAALFAMPGQQAM